MLILSGHILFYQVCLPSYKRELQLVICSDIYFITLRGLYKRILTLRDCNILHCIFGKNIGWLLERKLFFLTILLIGYWTGHYPVAGFGQVSLPSAYGLEQWYLSGWSEHHVVNTAHDSLNHIYFISLLDLYKRDVLTLKCYKKYCLYIWKHIGCFF